MKRNRYLISVLLGAVMIYYAIPQLQFNSDGLKGLFAFVWTGFALLVIAGNLSALLYLPRNKSYIQKEIHARKRIRSH